MNEKQCREILRERSGGRCEHCGKSWPPPTLHHRKKRSQGGTWSPTNCVMVDGSGTTGCHGWIEANPSEAEAIGFHVRPWQEPADIPLKYRGQMAYLKPDGSVEYVD